MDSRGPREDMGGGWWQLEANEVSLRNKQPANNSSWTWSLQNGKEAGVCMMLTLVAYGTFKGGPRHPIHPGETLKRELPVCPKKHSVSPPMGLEETLAKNLALTPPSWPGLRVPLLGLSPALCFAGLGVLQGVVVRVQNFYRAMSTLGGRAMPGSLVTHCLLQVWAAGDRQVAAFPPCGGLVTFPGASGVAWVELRMPGS